MIYHVRVNASGEGVWSGGNPNGGEVMRLQVCGDGEGECVHFDALALAQIPDRPPDMAAPAGDNHCYLDCGMTWFTRGEAKELAARLNRWAETGSLKLEGE